MATADATIRIVAQDKTQKAFKSVDKNLNKTSAALKGLAKRFVLAAGAAGVGGFIKSTVDSADKLDKLSKRLGMSVKALSEYKHVADLSGVSFETMTMGLQRMTRRVAEAAIGTGEAQGALKELNLDAEVLNQMPLDEKFETIAKAIGGMTSESDKVRVAMKLFDSEGVSLIQTMDKTGDKIAKARREARKLGLAIDADDAANAAAYKDEFVRLKGVFQGLANQTLPTLVPLITSLVQAITNGVTFVSKFGKEIGLVLTVLAELFIISKLTPLFVSMSAAIRGASVSAGSATIAFRALWKAIGGPIGLIVTLVTTFVMFKDEIFKAFPALERLYDWFATKIRRAIGWLIDKFKDLWKAFGTLRDWLRDKLGKVIEKFKEGLDDLKKKVSDVGKFIGKYLPNWMSDAEAATTDLEGEVEILYDAFGDLLAEVNHTTKELTIYIQEMKEGVGVTKDMEEKVSDLATELGLVNMSTAQAEKELKKFKDQVIETSDQSKLFHDKLVLLDEAYIDGDVNAETYKKELEKLQAGLSNGETAASDFKDELGEVDTAWGTFTGNIKSEWTTMWSNLFTGKGGIDSVKDFLKAVKNQFLQTLGEIVAEWTWKKIFGNLLGGDGASSVFTSILDKIVGAFTSAGTSSGTGFLSTIGAALKAGAGKIAGIIGSIFSGSSFASSGALIPDGVGGFMTAGTSAGTSFVAGFKSVLGNLAGFAAPLALAAYGFSQIRKRRRQDKREFAALMADQTVRAKMFLGEMTTGFKVIKQEGGHAWLQVSEAMNDYMGNLHQAGSSKSKGHFLWHELVRVRDEFGNVIARARDVPKLWNQINNATPFLRAIEESDKLMSNMERMKNGIEGNYIAGQLSLIAQGAGAIDIAYQAMADGVITATESIEMGLGETAVGTAEAFRRMTQDALVTESGLIRMGQAGVDALLSIDQQSVEFRSAMEDNLLDQVEAVQFGLGGLGDIGKDTFESMMEWAMRASDTTSALHSVTDILGDEFVQLGDKAINALKKIDLNADKVKQAMADGVVDATEAAQLGFSELGSRSVEEFMKIIEAVKSASGNMANLEDAARRAADAARAAARAANPASGGRGMQHGGSFIVGGGGGTDSQPVSFMATPGERVSVETPNQSKASGSDGGNVVRELRALRKDLATVVAKPIVGAVTRGQLAMAGGARH